MEIDKSSPASQKLTGAQATPESIKPYKSGPIKSDLIYLKAFPKRMHSFALLDIIMKVWNAFYSAIMCSKFGTKAYFSQKAVCSIALVVLKVQQLYTDYPEGILLIIMILVSSQILICLGMRALFKAESRIGQFCDSTLMDIYSISILLVFFIIALFDGILSIAPATIYDDLLSWKSIFTYLYELPEILFSALIIGLSGLFIGISVGEIIILVFLRKLRTLWATTRDVIIHLYVYNREIDECMCVICQSVFRTEDYVCTLTCKCKATYHKRCIAGWYMQNECCPLCRASSEIR